MKRIVLLISLFAGIGLRAQNQKNIVVDANAEPRMVFGYSAIEVSGAIDLYLSQGTEEGIAVSASSDEIRQRIKTELRGNTLQIYFDSKGLNWKAWGNHKMKAYVTFKTLSRLEASGACNVRATERIRQPELSIELSGASDFTGELAIGKLRIDASGASNAKLSGSAENLAIIASGACNLKAYDLTAIMCKTDASGASNIRISVEKELNAQASGGSTVYFKGNGLIRDISTSGGATVKRRSED
ncbi:head GIN domain-containing protein [Sediminibacterium soli]|uniref:head GIN domain-containing protein n=1 Tax=Sediminibacterium soli TaxID=2698829 RepID=UPI00137AF48B|nr:head GIN domain-containing protein [Sediminibacterium soli]NCI46892.1 DUF2807 domain-containing protein [Sediminibacterium soli]